MSDSEYAIMIFWSDEDGEYIATVPDLRGCSASGSTPEEALREVQVAKALWLESARAHRDAIPQPLWQPESSAEAAR